MSGSISLTVVVPALNEEKNIEGAVAGLTAALNSKGIEWEIILVNDGSTDLTPYIAADLAGEEPRIRVINHRRTMGSGRCFQAVAGLTAALNSKGIEWEIILVNDGS